MKDLAYNYDNNKNVTLTPNISKSHLNILDLNNIGFFFSISVYSCTSLPTQGTGFTSVMQSTEFRSVLLLSDGRRGDSPVNHWSYQCQHRDECQSFAWPRCITYNRITGCSSSGTPTRIGGKMHIVENMLSAFICFLPFKNISFVYTNLEFSLCLPFCLLSLIFIDWSLFFYLCIPDKHESAEHSSIIQWHENVHGCFWLLAPTSN